jgi:hypothetical protein
MDQEVFVDDDYKGKGRDKGNDKFLLEDLIYNRILRMVKQYGINKILNILIEVLNKNDSRSQNFEDRLVKEEINDISKIIRKDVLFIYLIKIVANSKDSPEIRLDTGLSGLYNETPRKRVEKSVRKEFVSKNAEKSVIKKRNTEEPNFQYRWKHFQWKNGKLYSYAPKSRTSSSKCTLYCANHECDAKVKIDMTLKKVIFIGNHTDHGGINIDKFSGEYPALLTND